MKLHATPLAIAAAIFTFASSTYAATVNLETFVLTAGATSNDTLAPNLATLIGTLGMLSTVSDVASFEYRFSYTDAPIDSAAFVNSNAAGIVALGRAPTGATGTTGWQTYTFQSPYSGTLYFALGNADRSDATELQIKNMVDTRVIPAVPEPESYAMLLAGLGIMGMVARRKSRSGMRFA